jgi:hypothetical protein
MEQEKIGFFSELIGSITNFETYRYFLKRTLGGAFLYLLLLSLIFGTASSIRSMYDFNFAITQVIGHFQTDVPEFTLENGELNIDGEMPMIFEEQNDDVLIIDTRENADETALDKYGSGMLITKYEFIQKHVGGGLERQSFSTIPGLRLSKESITGFLPKLRFINIFIVVFGVIFHFIGKVISALWLGIAGMVICASLKVKLDFSNQYKLGIYALTVPIILKALLKILRITIPYFWVLYYGIAIFYLWKGISAIKNNDEVSLVGNNEN